MSAALRIDVVGKPISVNAMYGRRANGKPYLTPAALAWRNAVWAYTLAAERLPCVCHTLTPPLRVLVTLRGVRGDADNYLKLTLDGLKLALRIDDKYFSPVTAHVLRGTQRIPGATIEIAPAEVAPAEVAPAEVAPAEVIQP